jgi:hypothetical protein
MGQQTPGLPSFVETAPRQQSDSTEVDGFDGVFALVRDGKTLMCPYLFLASNGAKLRRFRNVLLPRAGRSN